MSAVTLKGLLEEGAQYLHDRQITDGDIDAWYLLQHVCHVSRMDYILEPERPVTDAEAGQYRCCIRRRGENYPLQYITGEQEFMGIPFMVSEAVLIPRQDTELLVETVLENTAEDIKILDLCTGSGCILLSVMALKPVRAGAGVDLSEAALAVAAQNEQRIRAQSYAPHLSADSVVTWLYSDLYENVTGVFDVIVSNPPYIQSEEIDTLMKEVRCHEPRMALDGDADGLVFYRRIIADACRYLTKDGMIFLEIGWDQAAAVCALLAENGFNRIQVKKDLAGLDRVVYAARC